MYSQIYLVERMFIMKKLISLLLILGLTTSFTACSSLEDLAEDIQAADVSDGNNNGEDSPQTQSNQLNEKESLITATINNGDFTVIEELDKTIYEFHHPELENILYNKNGKVQMFYMLEGEGEGNYTTGNYYSDTTEIYVDYDEDENEIWAFYEDENEESYFPDCIFENNTISLTFTEPNYKPTEYEFILVNISTETDAFYYDGYFTDDVFEGENAEGNPINISGIKHDVILTNGRDTIEISFKEDGSIL